MQMSKGKVHPFGKIGIAYSNYTLSMIIGVTEVSIISAALVGLFLEANGIILNGTVDRIFAAILFHDNGDNNVAFFANSLVAAGCLFFLISFVLQTLKKKLLNQLVFVLISALLLFTLPILVWASNGGSLSEEVNALVPYIFLMTFAVLLFQCGYLVKKDKDLSKGSELSTSKS